MNFASYDFWQTLFFCFLASRLVIGLGLMLPDDELVHDCLDKSLALHWMNEFSSRITHG